MLWTSSLSWRSFCQMLSLLCLCHLHSVQVVFSVWDSNGWYRGAVYHWIWSERNQWRIHWSVGRQIGSKEYVHCLLHFVRTLLCHETLPFVQHVVDWTSPRRRVHLDSILMFRVVDGMYSIIGRPHFASFYVTIWLCHFQLIFNSFWTGDASQSEGIPTIQIGWDIWQSVVVELLCCHFSRVCVMCTLFLALNSKQFFSEKMCRKCWETHVTVSRFVVKSDCLWSIALIFDVFYVLMFW